MVVREDILRYVFLYVELYIYWRKKGMFIFIFPLFTII